MKKLLVLILVVAAAGGGYFYWQRSAAPQTAYRTLPVTRGDLLSTISATGTVEPVEVIDVGAQVAGKIKMFGEDPGAPGKVVDYGSTVEEGTVLALIDDALYAAEVDRSNAEVEQAKANVLRAQADLGQLKAKLLQAENNWKRARDVGTSGALSATDYDMYQAAYETAKATVAVGDATVVQEEKGVLQAEANGKRAKTNLEYCTIKSPVKGVIVDRRVNIGQTVVASLNAPSLFLIAKDLSKLQVWAAVNEADIGAIHAGQAVSFTVDAFPGKTFRGEVGKVRLNASMTQNVVTYTVEINTDNSDRKLLPYLTANLRFEVDRRENALLVPNAALRWKPSVEQVVPEKQESFAASQESGPRPGATAGGAPEGRPGAGMEGRRGSGDGAGRERPDRGSAGTASSRPAPSNHGTIWVQEGSFVRPFEVTVGLTDSTITEVHGEGVTEGMEVVVGEVEVQVQDQTNNPFAPKFIRSRR